MVTARVADLPAYHRDYNYEHFSYALEERELAYWSAAAPRLGQTAPPLVARQLDGGPWSLAEQLGRPVVIEFGSYTCPIFCGHVAAMEALATAHPEATFVIVYTREAHPGEVTAPHRAAGDLERLAKLTRTTERIRRLIILDNLDGDAHLRWGGGYNSVFVLDAQGHVVVRRFWNEPSDVRVALVQMQAGMRPIPAESVRFGAPSERGPFGSEMLARGGPQAVRDFATGAPARIIRGLGRSTDAVREVLRSVPGVDPAQIR